MNSPSSSNRSDATAPPCTLLVVEDEAIVAADLAEKLALLGYDVLAITPRGDEAVTLALARKPDLVLMDIRLQGPIDGITAAEQIRSHCDIPIVFLTAHSDPGTLHRAKIAEPFGYILKPFEERELHTVIEIALYKHQTERLLRESEQRYRSLFNYSLDAIFTLDEQGRFVNTNPAAERLSGYTQEELKERHFLELCVPELRDAAKDAFRDAFCLQCRDIESAMLRKDGTRRDLFVTGAPIILEGKTVGVSCLARDITERKASEQALRESQERLKAIVETAMDGIVTIDERGQIESVNPAIERIFGYTAEEIVGSNVAQIMPELDCTEGTEHAGYPARYLRTGERKILNVYREVRGQRKDGLKFDMELGVTETRLNGCCFFTGIIRDITERKRLEDKLIKADRRKDEFIATLAHELRNPIGPIRNVVTVLRRKALTDTQLTWCGDVIERQAMHMARLLDDLLDVSRITRSKLTLRREWLELATVIEQAVETVRPLIDARKHTLEVALPPEPSLLEGDPVRLTQVFSNLLTNAAKYTSKGGQIWLTAERCEGEVVVSIKDSGIGITAKHLPQVFEMFSQVESALNRSEGGLGIGLSLVKGLVELHGGRIAAHSEGLSKGSEFVVHLPALVGTPAAKPEPGSADGETLCLDQHRILVVDDNRDNAESLALMLETDGHEVRIAYDGAEAVEVAEAFRPDVMLLDIGMPKLNGYEACRRIREQPWGKDILIIAQTGWGQEEDRCRTKEAGFDHHLTKPIDPVILMDLLA